MLKLYSFRLLLLIQTTVLVLVMLWAMAGVNYQFLVQRNAIRKEIKKKIKEGVSEKEMQVFYLPYIENDPGFRWENDHEFFYRGSMYDVVKREGEKLQCINDDQESILFRNLDEQSRKAQRENSNSGKTLQLKWVMVDLLHFNLFIEAEEQETVFPPEFPPQSVAESVFLPPDLQLA